MTGLKLCVAACCLLAVVFPILPLASAQTGGAGAITQAPASAGAVDNGTHKTIDTGKTDTVQKVQHVIVQVLTEPPFITPSSDAPYKYEGMFVDVLTYLFKKINVTFTLKAEQEYAYGREISPGNWTGLIGNLQIANDTPPNDMHMAVAPLTISRKRSEVVEFTYPIMSSGLRILYKPPNPWTDSESFAILLSPFTAGLWVVILLMFIAVSVLFYLIGRFSPYEDHAFVGKAATYEGLTLINSFLYTFTSLTFQGYTAAPRSMSGKVLAAFWWMFVLLVIAAYTASLCAVFLAFKPSIKQVPFATFDELARQSHVAYAIVGGGSTEYYLKNSNRTIEQLVYSRIVADAQNRKVSSIADGMSRLQKSDGDFALILEGPLAEYEVGKSPCGELMVLGEELGHHTYAFACKKGIDICQKLQPAILQMWEEDYIYALKQKWFYSRHDCPSQGNSEYIFEGMAFFDTFGGQPKYYADRNVTLTRFGTGFLLIFIGMLGAALILIGEIFYAKRRGTAIPQRLPRSGMAGMDDDQVRIDREFRDDVES